MENLNLIQEKYWEILYFRNELQKWNFFMNSVSDLTSDDKFLDDTIVQTLLNKMDELKELWIQSERFDKIYERVTLKYKSFRSFFNLINDYKTNLKDLLFWFMKWKWLWVWASYKELVDAVFRWDQIQQRKLDIVDLYDSVLNELDYILNQ